MNEIIVVKQLPVIEQQLAQIKEQVAERVSAAMQLVCTEATVKEIKKARAELNAEFKAWEDKRKEVKTAVMSPYEQFEAVYKDCISDAYKAADKDLKQKVDEVEQELKNQKLAEVKSYFQEYLASKDIDFISYEQAGINVTLSASLKSLKEQAKTFIDRIESDMKLIETFTDLKAEILVEYKKSLNVSDAITGVKARTRAIQEEQARQEAEAKKRDAEAQRVEAIKAAAALEAIRAAEAAPVEAPTEQTAAPAPKKIFCIRFTVKGTREQLIALKKFLNEGEYEYE